MVTLAIVIPTMASSEFAVLSVTALVPTAFEVFRSKSCAILYSYNAIAIATAKPFDAPPEVIPKLAGVIFFIVPPSSTKTKSASLLDVVVVGVSELPVVNTVVASIVYCPALGSCYKLYHLHDLIPSNYQMLFQVLLVNE